VAWEIEIKSAIGKLRAPSDLAAQMSAANFQELPITIAHALALGQLPNLHRDPFDRIMLTQARAVG
jgi:PIN domain nuclease of toxin-antitoxin system